MINISKRQDLEGNLGHCGDQYHDRDTALDIGEDISL